MIPVISLQHVNVFQKFATIFLKKTLFLFQETAKVSIMVLFKNDLQSLDYQELVESSLMNKDPNCALYSKEGKRFSVHKEILYQTQFMRNIMISANVSCCSGLEIFCPCSEIELEEILNFFYKGEISFSNVNDLNRISDNLTKIFGYPEKLPFLEEQTFVKTPARIDT